MKKLSILLSLIILTACSGGREWTNKIFTDKYLRANLTFLASDELEGRETTTRGEKLASLFIASELNKYGIKPLGDSGTYFQKFALNVAGFSEDSKITLSFDTVKYDLKLGDDFVRAFWYFPSTSYLNKSSEIVFAGYGIDAPEYEYNDYSELDVTGKTVLLLTGEPESDDPDFFDGEKRSKYSRTNYKINTAKDKGAVGVLFLPDSTLLKYWKRFASWTKSESFNYSSDSKDSFDGIPAFSLSLEAANKLLSSVGLTIKDLQNYLDDFKRPNEFKINTKINFDLKINIRKKYARNVVGILPGIDDSLKHEYVVLSAHYDHLGKRGEDIFNGADDDGSGTAVILDAARTLSIVRKNKRSILFVFHTAEEKGLLGSRYFTEHFDYMDKIRADINIDMVGRGSVDTIYNIGSGKLSEEFYRLVRSANDESVKFVFNYKFDDPNDPNRFYYRSDHVHYANKGIPIVFFYDYMKKDYHRSTDTVEKINFEKMAKMVNLAHHIALKVANLNHPLKLDKNE